MIKAIFVLLLVVHGLLAVWALVGFVELFWATPPWSRVSNPLFPGGVLFLQWALTLLAAAVFIGGYIFRWHNMPVALACVYVAMASLCAVQTFMYMESDTRFIAMGLEYAAYVFILLFLFRVQRLNTEHSQ